MDWTKPLSFVLALLIASLVIRSVFQLLQTTLTGEYVIDSVVTLALVALFLIVAVGLGAKNRQWLANPESYW